MIISNGEYELTNKTILVESLGTAMTPSHRAQAIGMLLIANP